jgi:FAD/FMN-containing dehydrogenase
MSKILEKVTQAKSASFLAVLKLYGKANENYLSFPMEGYSLALDFKVNDKVLNLLEELDKIVVKFKGRIYLAKDARVSKAIFEQGYPQIEKFRTLRKKQGMDKVFVSAQSKRLDL